MPAPNPHRRPSSPPPLRDRIAGLAWGAVESALWERGHARLSRVLTPRECEALIRLYSDEARFRSRVEMARHRFGLGEYKYFAMPLPAPIPELRTHLYAALAPIANRWSSALGSALSYPADLEDFRALCARRGQTKPTPLLLRYEAGGFNCLHQDVYGEVAFPFQAVALLSRPGVDFTGGELLFVEQRPRAQSAGAVVIPEQGELVVFTNRLRPVEGARGFHRVSVRHGLSRVHSGERYALGVIFHEAR